MKIFVRAIIALLTVLALTSSLVLSFSAVDSDPHNGIFPSDLSASVTDTLYVGNHVSSATVSVSTYSGSNFLLGSGASFSGTARGISHTFLLYDSDGGFDIGFEPYFRFSRLGTLNNGEAGGRYCMALWDSSLLYDSYSDPTHSIPAVISSVEIRINDESFLSVTPSSTASGNGGTFYVFEFDLPIVFDAEFTLWVTYDLLGYQDVYAFSQNFRFYGMLLKQVFDDLLSTSLSQLLNFFDPPDFNFGDLNSFISDNSASLAGWASFISPIFNLSIVKIPLLICLALAIFSVFLSLSSRIGSAARRERD